MNETDLKAMETRLKASRDIITALCKPRGIEGSREWVMSIPPNEQRDPDLILGATCQDTAALIDAVRSLKARLKEEKADSDMKNTAKFYETKSLEWLALMVTAQADSDREKRTYCAFTSQIFATLAHAAAIAEQTRPNTDKTLLEACKAALEWISDERCEDEALMLASHEIQEHLEKAIAKAEETR